MTQKIDLNPSELALVIEILKRYLPAYEIWAFGSRVKHTAKKFSDLDLAIISENPLSISILGELKEAFSESNLSIKVDVVDWARTDEDFKKLIQSDHVVLQEGQRESKI